MPSLMISLLNVRSLLHLCFLCIILLSSTVVWAQETDKDMPVGAVGGAVHADPFTGTATTSIPIEVPPGRQGVQPDLALVYGSSNGNGWLGMGWKLEKGVIERQTKMGVDYNGDDYVFRLSGINVELVNIGNDEYRAKVEGGFTRVEKLTDSLDGKPYFKATDKTGKVFIFGSEPGTRVTDPNDPNNIFRWCLERVEDVHGNYMTLSYTSHQGQAYLSQIHYTGHGNTNPTNQVIFHLEDRPDAAPMYVPNFEMNTAKRLKSIVVKANSQIIRGYKLSYLTSAITSRSLLDSVQQYGKNVTINASGILTGGTVLPGINVNFSQPDSQLQSPVQALPSHVTVGGTSVPTSGGAGYNWLADVNGDGKTDYIWHQNGVYVALATETGLSAPQQWLPSHVTVSGSSVQTWSTPEYTYGLRDMNGDGKADYVWHQNRLIVALSTGTGFLPPVEWLPSHVSVGGATIQTWGGDGYNWLSDVNGDGKTDYIWHQNGVYIALSTGVGMSAPQQWLPSHVTVSGSSVQTWSTPEYTYGLRDMNGDGKADYVWHQNRLIVALSTGSGFLPPVEWLPSHVSVGGATIQTWGGDGYNWLSDVNGDGKTDYIWHQNGVYIALSTGVGMSAPQQWLPSHVTVSGSSVQTWSTPAYTYGLRDMNGDGKADYVWHQNRLIVALSTGTGFLPPVEWLPSHVSVGGATVQTWGGDGYNWLSDVNGDGKTDYIWHQNGVYIGFGAVGMPDTAQSILNGLGGSTTIEYTPSTEYDNTQLPYPIQTVSKITTDDGNGHVATTTYDYEGGYHHLGERDFRGFHKVTVTGQAGPSGEQTVTTTWFHQGNDHEPGVNDPHVADGYLKGAPYKVEVHDGQGHLYSRTTTTYQEDTDGAPFFSPPTSTVTDICEGNGCRTQTQTNFTYDLYGNVTHEYQYGDVGVASDDRTVVRTYDPNTTAWILGLPTSETIYEGLGTGTQLAQTSFYYDGTTSCNAPSSQTQPTKGQLTRVVKWLNTGPNPETRMAYNSHGNVTCTRDAKGNMTTMAYDASGTFATSVRNAKGHTTTTQYYGVNGIPQDTGLYGQVKRVTDPNGAVVSSTYDALGRRLTVTQPDGFTTTTSYHNFGTVGSQHVQTASTVNGTPLSTWTFFDGLGRTMASKRTGTDAKIIISTAQYDHRGAVTRSSTPYFEAGGSPLWTTNTYDPLGRVIKTTNPDGSQGQACFDEWVTVTIDANQHKKRTTRDAYGRVITVQEYTGTHASCTTSEGTPYSTTTYQYDDLGNLTRLTDTLGNQSLMSYDTLSRKVSMTDPDMGTWTYAYDANGNLTRQTDAKGQQIHFQYDLLNRRLQKDFTTQKSLGNGDVVYTYDGSTHHRTGRLQQVTDGIGTTTFFYDRQGRVIKTDKVVEGTTYTTQSAYDSLGRVTQLTYPDSSTVTQSYNGPQLEQVKEGSTIYASYGGFNALGQPSTLTLGNGVTTTYTYDPQTFRLQTLETKKGTTVLQDLQYAFDDGGNVTTLIDATHGTQTYGYDALDRLTSATHGGQAYPALSYTYNQIGNLTHTSQLGSYTYPNTGSARPHAVTAAGGQTYGYDDNGNMISGAGRTISYDQENRPISITTTTTSGGGGGSGGSGTAVTEWEFDVGTRVGGHDLHNGSVLGSSTLSQAVSNVPTNGHPVYVRLKSKVGSTWSAVDYTYTASGSSAGQQLTSPPIGSVLTSALPTFTWNPHGITPNHWYIEIKEAGQSANLYDSGNIASTQTSHTVTVALPTDGRDLTVRLWSEINGNWSANDFPYVSMGAASSGGGSGVLNNPTPSSVLSGSSVTFAWSDPNSGGSSGGGTPVTDWELDLGTRLGADDLHNGSVLSSATLSQAVSNLPTNGQPVYVRLKSKVGSTWSAVDYTYTASGSSAGQQLTSPLIGSVLTSALPTFSWNPHGVTPNHWYIEIKEAGQSANLYDSGNIASSQTSHTVTVALPTDGRDLTVRLWSEINGNWSANDFPYVSPGAASSGGGSGVLNNPTPSSVLSGSSVTFAWSDSNGGGSGGGGGGITTTKTTTLHYDGDGGRVKKTVDDGSLITWTTYIGKLYVCEGTAPPLSCAKMIFSGSQRIAIKQVGSGSTSYFHPDHLGSTSVLTDGNGVSEQDISYYPYGDTRSNTGTADVPYKYTGKEQDNSTGLYFYEARYYDPVLGRFISADTIVPSLTNPQALNRYAYANNNPVLYTDPSGHFGFKSIKKGFKKVSRKLQRKLGSTGFTAFAFGVQIGLAPFLSPIQGGILGTALLTQSKSGRYVLAGEIIIGTAVASWQCGGCGAWTTGAAWGAAGTGAAGAYSAAVNGGDISKGLLLGSAVGAVAGGFGSYYAPSGEVFKTLSLIEKVKIVAVTGSVTGAAGGAANNYAGGRGSIEGIVVGIVIGAGTGAIFSTGFTTISHYSPGVGNWISETIQKSIEDIDFKIQGVSVREYLAGLNSIKIHPSISGPLNSIFQGVSTLAVNTAQYYEQNQAPIHNGVFTFGSSFIQNGGLKSFCKEGGRCNGSGKF